MAARKVVLSICDVDIHTGADGACERVGLATFARVNSGDRVEGGRELVRRVRKLRVGESFTDGGGGAPFIRIRRES